MHCQLACQQGTGFKIDTGADEREIVDYVGDGYNDDYDDGAPAAPADDGAMGSFIFASSPLSPGRHQF